MVYRRRFRRYRPRKRYARAWPYRSMTSTVKLNNHSVNKATASGAANITFYENYCVNSLLDSGGQDSYFGQDSKFEGFDKLDDLYNKYMVSVTSWKMHIRFPVTNDVFDYDTLDDRIMAGWFYSIDPAVDASRYITDGVGGHASNEQFMEWIRTRQIPGGFKWFNAHADATPSITITDKVNVPALISHLGGTFTGPDLVGDLGSTPAAPSQKLYVMFFLRREDNQQWTDLNPAFTIDYKLSSLCYFDDLIVPNLVGH